MEQQQQAPETCSSAHQLARLWKRPAHAKLLLRPPAATISAKRIGLFQNSIQYAAALEEAAHAAHEQLLVQQQPDAHLQCFLQDVLASHAVATLAQLLAWLLPRLDVLQLPALSADAAACSGHHHTHGALWLACSRALVVLLDCVCSVSSRVDSSSTASSSSSAGSSSAGSSSAGSRSSGGAGSSSSKAVEQVGLELHHAGLPQQLPNFLWEAAAVVANGTPLPRSLPAITQHLRSLPLSQATSLVRAVVYTLAHPNCISVHPMNWHWADQLLQQLLKCAMAAGLLRALPEGCLAAAGIAVDHNPSGGSSSGTGRRPISDAERLICTSVTASAGCLFDAALRQRDATKGGGRDEEMQTHFVSQPVVAEVALQLLAVRCLLTHKQLAQWQQQQRGLMSGQQGRHMRRDVLLLLPSDLQQHLAQLLPPGVMIDVIAANTAAGRTSNDMPAGQQHWEEMRRLVSVLQLHVTIVENSQSDGSISSPALSAAVLQLSAVLLLLAAAEWQRQWCALTVQQQELLKADTAALDEAAVIEASRMRQPLAPAAALVTQSCLLLQQQTQVLWSNGQWQPQLQLLQQGGGEVLLQALTLAMHCSSVDSGLRSHADLRYFKLLQVVMSLSGDEALEPRRDLFVSQLARKHPVPFFRLLDRCERSGQTDSLWKPFSARLARAGSCRVGTKGLAELLSSPAATATLCSALCSIRKKSGLQEVQFMQHLSMSLAPAVREAAAIAAAGPAVSSTSTAASSSRGQQAEASAVFLLVLMGRGLLALHTAAASRPDGATFAAVEQAADGAMVEGNHWLHCSMHDMLSVFNGMWQALQTLGVLSPELATYSSDNTAATAADSAQAITAERDQASSWGSTGGSSTGGNSTGSSSSERVGCNDSSSSQSVRWQYLLRLHESRKLAAAAAAFTARWSQDEVQSVLQIFLEQREAETAAVEAVSMEELQALVASGAEEIPRPMLISDRELLQGQQLYRDALAFCRALVAVAPLPVVCNNPGCAELGGVSEAAAARYVCAGCGCRYCGAACQAAGWKSHKKGCRRMSACGMRVDGKQ